MAGNSYSFAPTASDANGDVLSFTVQNLPSWATFDAATGRVSGTPSQADVGTYPGIRIRATDGELTTSSASFTVSVVETASGSATLSWSAPTEKTDGSPLTLGGYKVYWGTSSGDYSNSVTLDNPGIVTYVIEGLTPATWYFAATAYDSQGIESEFSNEASKEVL